MLSQRKGSHCDVDPTTYTRYTRPHSRLIIATDKPSIMHAHTRAQLAASTSPAAIATSPSLTTVVVTPTTTTITIPASAAAAAPASPPDPKKSPIQEVIVVSSSRDKTIIVEASNTTNSGDSSSDSSDITNNNTSGRISAEFNAMNLHIPLSRRTPNASRRGSAATTSGVMETGRGKEKTKEKEQGQWRRKSEGAAMVLTRDWDTVVEGVEAAFGRKMGNGGGECAEVEGGTETGVEEQHAQTRLRCSCDECEEYRARKGVLARNGLCMALGRRDTV